MGMCQPARQSSDISTDRSSTLYNHPHGAITADQQHEQQDSHSVIHLKFHNIDDEQLEQICKTRDTQRIKCANLSWNQITSLGVLHLSRANWKKLTELKLWKNRVGDKGCKWLTRSHLPELRTLSLTENKVTSAGVIHLSKKEWPRLRGLDLSDNKIGVDGVKFMTKIAFRKLKTVGLRQNKVTLEEMFYCLQIVRVSQEITFICDSTYFLMEKMRVLFRLANPNSDIA